MRGDHEEPKEPVRQDHLDPLVVRGHVALGIVAPVRVLPPPLEPARGQLVGREGHGPRGEAARDDHGPLAVPGRVVRHDLGVGRDVLGNKARHFFQIFFEIFSTSKIFVLFFVLEFILS